MWRRRGTTPLWLHMPTATADTIRIEALSDGVFAVAMTLLVIDLRVPELAQQSTFAALGLEVLKLWPHFLSYAVSFLIVGLYWVSHQLLFDLIRRSDRGLLWINIIFLLFVAVIPFSTALLGRYHDNHFAILLYGANLILVGLALQTLWTYATTNHRLVDASLEAQTIRLGTVRLMAVPLIGALSMVITFVNVPLGMAIYVGLLVLYSWPGRWTPYWSVAPERSRTKE
jgi:uncharacterized membrane protein